MNKTIKAVSVIGGLLLIMLFVYAELSKWHIGPEDNSTTSPTITLSEFEQEDGTGIYITHVLEVTDGTGSDGKWDYAASKTEWGKFTVQLIDNEGLTYHDHMGSRLIDNYSGNQTGAINQSTQISNDNGTEFPIHIQNHMGPYEYYNYTPDRDILLLSPGDMIKIYGSGSDADGPAREGWPLRIKYGRETVSEIKIA